MEEEADAANVLSAAEGSAFVCQTCFRWSNGGRTQRRKIGAGAGSFPPGRPAFTSRRSRATIESVKETGCWFPFPLVRGGKVDRGATGTPRRQRKARRRNTSDARPKQVMPGAEPSLFVWRGQAAHPARSARPGRRVLWSGLKAV